MGVLNLVGLGLAKKFITKSAVDALLNSDFIFFDRYTSKSCDINTDSLKEILNGKDVIEANRDLLENNSKIMLNYLDNNYKVSIATIGDALIATTHVSLALDARKRGHIVNVIPAVSVHCYIVSKSFLSSYKFGKSVTVTFPYDNFIDYGPYHVIRDNKERGLHTIIYLDLKDGKAMTANDALNILLSMEDKHRMNVISKSNIVIVGARLGCENEKVIAMTVEEALNYDFGDTPHIIIIPGTLHYMEADAIKWMLMT
ncbi:diphthine synthase [Sulfolobus sp. A20]|uniref:diphthine synthase n=1 Tax=Sulfolobaceae TaxID=118883 RepID=UPI0008462803|nr:MULTISPECIES: diphthine synthase [unclassified Sulfolobus]TRM74500.1 diphthine synthase [Sulfolobus sp. E5]TRM78204.1 diphthine synthase [Sulfolobus sp. A20-N-F8]TRM79393.1 diphthine synthase [Sulfolobus sp. B5]TRM80826.1 diphthine synthase [Sulfolobus sp. D5]TRM84178.1 diphthine synthase [Sulfolobus sp. A20-N-F6]TRM88864.1 diphthine synthase [Sulfolobus sp. C3]TRM93265.1 diphthine synthase [Sulfolobus sp. A20-N-G8]TRM98114.1 diphthine synthase [Sulfolobus sp. E1]TRM98660.1 diphthine sy